VQQYTIVLCSSTGDYQVGIAEEQGRTSFAKCNCNISLEVVGYALILSSSICRSRSQLVMLCTISNFEIKFNCKKGEEKREQSRVTNQAISKQEAH
jgi:hypothetical protein